MERFNKYWIGIVVGLILPAIFGALYIERMGIWTVIFKPEFKHMLCNVLLLAPFPNMALVFLFYKTDTWKLAKGVVLGIVPYLLASFIINLL